MDPLTILKERFGFRSFRMNQQAIIDSVLRGRDTFVLMPTGGGKSICYQVPALMLEGTALVISPLIALMKDQVDALRMAGIEAAYLNSAQPAYEQDRIMKMVCEKKLKLLYMAPERLLQRERRLPLLDLLSTFQVSLIAIDEAHCISHWGHDFRPEYLCLSELKRAFPGVPVIALTATADRQTQRDIVEKLSLDDPAIFISSFNRPNIRYSVVPKRDCPERLIQFLEQRRDESGIIYCLSRKSTEALAGMLQEKGFNAVPYHAGLDREVRSKHQEMFQTERAKIIVATIAFGMGIDKPNVRYVVHMDLPKNIESYYQETGRAGRDGLESEAILFYSPADVIKLKKFVMIENNPEQTKVLLRKLNEMAKFGELRTCRRRYLLNYFNESASAYCGNCDVCLANYEAIDGTNLARKVFSAVEGVNQKYGVNYIVDILRGSEASRIDQRHRGLDAFSTGRDLSRNEWIEVINDLITEKYLARTTGLYPLIRITEKGRRAIENDQRVLLRRRKKPSIESRVPNGSSAMYNKELLEQLKSLRRRLADQEGIADYLVISDVSIVEIATYFPHTDDELAQITGLGATRIQKFGHDIINVVVAYCRAHDLAGRMNSKTPLRAAMETPGRDGATRKMTLALYKQGLTVEEIAAQRNLTVGTIDSHLAYYVRKGVLRIEDVIDTWKVERIQEALAYCTGPGITPVKETLGKAFSYDDIRFVIAWLDRLKAEEPRLTYVTGMHRQCTHNE